jgi:hypothetical protein
MNRMPATRKSAFIWKSLPSHSQRFEDEPQREDGSDAVEQVTRIHLRAVSSDLAAEHVREKIENSNQRDQPGSASRNPPHRAVPPHALSVTGSIVPQCASDETVHRVGSRPGQGARVLPGQVAGGFAALSAARSNSGRSALKQPARGGSRAAHPNGPAAIGGPIAFIACPACTACIAFMGKIVPPASRRQMINP